MGMTYAKAGFLAAMGFMVFFKVISIVDGIGDHIDMQRAATLKVVPLSHYTEQYLPRAR